MAELDDNGLPPGVVDEAEQILKDMLADWHNMPSETRRRLETLPGYEGQPRGLRVFRAVTLDCQEFPPHFFVRASRLNSKLPEWD